jgi:hypothetical protein
MADLNQPTSDLLPTCATSTCPSVAWRSCQFRHAGKLLRITLSLIKSRRILNLVGRRLKVSLASRLVRHSPGALAYHLPSAPGQAYRSRWAEGHVCDKARRERYTSTPFAFALRDGKSMRVRASASSF